MNTYYLPFILIFLFSSACSAGNMQNKNDDVVSNDIQTSCKTIINNKFASNLNKKGFLVHSPIDIAASKLIDNMWQLDKFFKIKKNDIFTYNNLSKYRISNTKNKSSASLYCFHFDNQKSSTSWFNVFYKTKQKGQLKISFGRPKKMLVLIGNTVIFVEGYSMSNFEALQFIVTNLDGEKSILDPNSM